LGNSLSFARDGNDLIFFYLFFVLFEGLVSHPHVLAIILGKLIKFIGVREFGQRWDFIVEFFPNFQYIFQQ
jgi:hypothetical protein